MTEWIKWRRGRASKQGRQGGYIWELHREGLGATHKKYIGVCAAMEVLCYLSIFGHNIALSCKSKTAKQKPLLLSFTCSFVFDLLLDLFGVILNLFSFVRSFIQSIDSSLSQFILSSHIWSHSLLLKWFWLLYTCYTLVCPGVLWPAHTICILSCAVHSAIWGSDRHAH